MNLTKVGLLAFILALASPVLAATDPNPDITRRELQNFDNFLDTHPGIDAELSKNPRLIESPAYISSHPELREFLQTHPGVREEMKETPRYFMHREERFDKSGRDETFKELANLDIFLDTHPGIEKELRKDPTLARNPEFVAKHPEFSEFLSKHPAIKADLKENPRAFMKREKELERLERLEARENARHVEKRRAAR